jgi:hypothetical protein
MARYARPPVVCYSAEQVWGAACAAQRINGEYLKDTEMIYCDALGVPLTTPITKRQANKHLMREMLAATADPRLTAADIAEGVACRTHYQGLIFKELAGKLNSGFLKAVYALSDKDEFQSNAFIELAQIAASPQGWVRDANLEKAALGKYVGNIGDKITGEVEITECNYSNNYGIFFAHGFIDGNAVFFAHKSKMEPGSKVLIKGTVKAQRDNFTTQLNRVKEVK